jgi:hypothetical protein
MSEQLALELDSPPTPPATDASSVGDASGSSSADTVEKLRYFLTRIAEETDVPEARRGDLDTWRAAGSMARSYALAALRCVP